MGLKVSDPKITDQEALDYTLHAKNMEMTTKRYSPFQIVYGENPRIPGIINGNPPSFSNDFTSEDVKNHFFKVQAATEAFRAADHDKKLKRA